MASTAAYSDAEKTKDKLNDDLQLLFVTLVLEHAEAVLKSIDEKKQPPPLYLLLLGTAGTGKTTATQTMLQELQEQLKATGLISEFSRVAAPTGTAAVNVRCMSHALVHSEFLPRAHGSRSPACSPEVPGQDSTFGY